MSRKGLIFAAGALAATAAAVAIRTRRAERRNPPIGRFIEVDGVRLHYHEAGSGEPIVFLHGNGSLIQDFVTSDLIRLVARTHRVIVFDRPGYGYSERPRSRLWTPAAQADLLAKAMAQLGMGKASLFGHSWGTLVALEWALRHPGSVSALTLASGYYFPTPRLDVVLAAGPALPLVGDVLRYTLSPLLARLLWPILSRQLFAPARVAPSFRQMPRALILAPHALRASAEESALMLPAAAKLMSRYGELRMPVLVVTGDGDRVVQPDAQSRRLSQRLPAGRLLVLPDVGHMVHHMEPRRLAEAMTEPAR